jgi:purine-nucleoside phosphorylase
MSVTFEDVEAAAELVRSRIPCAPGIGLVLGSGLGAFAGRLETPVSIPYGEIPGWPPSRVVGHEGRLVVGTRAGRAVAVLSGRAHFYEGHSLQTVVFATRVLGRLGIKTLILTNAAGGINPGFAQGALMVIDDHLNFLGSNPLVGANDDRFGPRFPDMSAVYSPRLRALAHEVAASLQIPLAHGVYIGVHGPSYETPAEIRAFRTLGADAVGMSTVPEAIVARHMGVEVMGISCITNMAAGVLPAPLNHEDVMETARRVGGQFMALLDGIIAKI